MTAFVAGLPDWTALTTYVAGTRVQPTAHDNRVFTVTTAGTSGGSEPTWPTNEPWTVVDGTVTWTKASSARRQFVAGVYTSLAAFRTANPTLVNDLVKARPANLATLAMPALYIGARDESVSMVGAMQTRQFSGLEVVYVDTAPDSLQAMTRSDDVVDALVDWFSSRFHAASGQSLLLLGSVSQVDLDEGGVHYVAQVLSFGPSTVTEGRS